MQLHVEHTTEYSYSEPNRHSIQYVRMAPLTGPGQDVHEWSITAPRTLCPWIDGFGNRVNTLVIDDEHVSITLTVKGVVSTRDTNGITPYNGTPEQAMFLLQGTALTKASDGLRDLVSTVGERADRLDFLHDLMQTVRKKVDYVTGGSDVTTTAAGAFEAGKGVCQDHAHIFCVGARLAGIPARYVSGYLSTPVEGGQQDASHAWAEALVPDLGWVGFDPANLISQNEHYIKVAIGRDYRDAAPVRGLRTGAGEELLAVSVAVRDSATIEQHQ